MENSKNVQKDIEEFKICIQELGNKVNQAGIEWKDEKFQELTKAIQQIANNAKELVIAGEECQKNIQNFETYIDQ